MFFYLIRPLIRWKINALLDDDRQPGGFFLWLLKKDGNSWQYYQNLLQLDAKLRESVPKFSEALISGPTPDRKTHVDSNRRFKSYDNPQKKNIILYTASLSAAVVLLVALAMFLRSGPDGEIVATLPPPQPVVIATPPVELVDLPRKESGLPSELRRLTAEVVPSGVRKMLAPAFVPLKETYDVGRNKLLDDLDSLPIQPLTDFGQRLYSVRDIPDSAELTPKDDDERVSGEGLLSRWLNPDLLKINWLGSDHP